MPGGPHVILNEVKDLPWISALLLGILMPALSAARAQAQAVACTSNLRQIATACVMYAQDQKVWVGYLPGSDRKQMLYPYLQQGKSNADVSPDHVWHCPANARPDVQASYGFNTNLNFVKMTRIRYWSETVALCDAGLLDSGQPTLITHCWPPSRTTAANAVRPDHLRHPKRQVGVAFADGHAERMPMNEPFYPGPAGEWAGNNVSNLQDPNYKDQLWDLQ